LPLDRLRECWRWGPGCRMVVIFVMEIKKEA
jgi:hypothetical protein